jgi:hypothetical protein
MRLKGKVIKWNIKYLPPRKLPNIGQNDGSAEIPCLEPNAIRGAGNQKEDNSRDSLLVTSRGVSGGVSGITSYQPTKIESKQLDLRFGLYRQSFSFVPETFIVSGPLASICARPILLTPIIAPGTRSSGVGPNAPMPILNSTINSYLPSVKPKCFAINSQISGKDSE